MPQAPRTAGGGTSAPSIAHTTHVPLGDARPLTRGTGAEPMGRLQVLDVRWVLAGDVDGGGWRGWFMKPGLAGGLCV